MASTGRTPAPDFHCVGLLGDFFVEATTVNPSDEVPTVDLENENVYYDGYVPRKFGSALFSKIKKKYWELPHVNASPLVLAIQDFHAPGSMVWSNTGLVQYLLWDPAGGQDGRERQTDHR